MLNAFFFFFPFFLYLGIALQGLSYYFIGITVPSLFIILARKKIPSYFIKVGSIFILLHIIFPIVNFLVYFFPNKSINESVYKIALRWPGILQSNFPSSLFFGGIAIIIFTIISRMRAEVEEERIAYTNNVSKKNRLLPSLHPLKFFLAGLIPASILFAVVMIYQHYLGIDLHSLFRKNIEYLSKDELLQTGGYRVWGFYGHPLTIAGVCLAYAVFTWTLLCNFISSEKRYLWTFIPGKENKTLSALYLGAITLSNFICLMVSGGRTAGVVGIIFIIITPLLFNLRKNFFTTLFLVLLIALSSFFISKKLGMINRIGLVTHSIEKNNSFDLGNYRQYFWLTYEKMFLDKPLIGQGNYWLKQGVREEYYRKLGFEKLPEKYIAHNVYLETLGATGLLGFIWILIALICLVRIFKKNIFYNASPLKPLSYALLFAFIANLLHGFTQNVFFDSSVDYIYLGLILVIMWESVGVKKLFDVRLKF